MGFNSGFKGLKTYELLYTRKGMISPSVYKKKIVQHWHSPYHRHAVCRKTHFPASRASPVHTIWARVCLSRSVSYLHIHNVINGHSLSVKVNVNVSTDYYDLCFVCCKEEVLQCIDYATMVVNVTRIIH